MGENIEVKDVQKTEYLDKNGLDMLWAKVKENTRNQVEVEYNRAKAKEDSLSQEIASVKPAEGKVFLQAEATEDARILEDYVFSFGDYRTGVYAGAAAKGFFVQKDTEEVEISSTGIKADVARESDTKVWNTKGGITDLANYAKKTDVPEVDTSDFISKTVTDEQAINSTLGILGGNIISVIDYTADGDTVSASLSSSMLGFDGCDRSTIQLNGSDVNSNNGSRIIIEAYNENPQIILQNRIGSDYAFQNNLTITNEGISNTDNNANHVFATDGSIADLTQYARKEDIATKESLGVVKVGDGLNVANDGTISVDSKLYVTDMVSYGVEWDTTVADPACTRIGNPLLHKQLPIQSEYKGCLVKNGKVNYYLDPNDWSKKADGTPSVLDGTDGDVMVHIPKFYGKSGSNGNKRWVRITTTKIDQSWVEIPEMFVSAYKITTYMDSDTPKIASVVNTTANYRGGSNRYNNDQYLHTDIFKTDLGKPRTGIPRATMRTRAINSGQELLCYEFYKWVFYWSYVIEYADFNSQKRFNSELTSDGYHQGGLGSGVSDIYLGSWIDYNSHNPLVPCGYTNDFGNFSGEKTTYIKLGSDSMATAIHPNRWRGFENPFGDIETCLDGIVLKMDSANSESKVYTTTDSSKFGDNTSVMNIAGIEGSHRGYIVEFDLRETGEIIPQSSNNAGSATGSKYKCDYHSLDYSNTNNRMLFVGGTAQYGDMNGLCSFSSNNVDYATPYIGYRSVIRA